MPDNMAARRRAIAKAIYVLVIGWIWIVASLATVYFVATAAISPGSWWRALASAACAWIFYKLAQYYGREDERNFPIADE